MTSSTSTARALATDAIDRLDQALGLVRSQADGQLTAAAPPPTSPTAEAALIAASNLEAYGGPAIAGPVRVAVHDVAAEVAQLGALLDQARGHAGQAVAFARSLEGAADQARPALICLDEALARSERRADSLERRNEELADLADALEELYRSEARFHAGTLTPTQIASRIRETRKAAAKATAVRLAAENPPDA